MAANEDLLGKLHSAVANVLLEAMKGQTLPGYSDEDGNEVEAQVLPPSASVMTVAAKFLKDNNITCEPSDDNELGALAAVMSRRQAGLRNLDKTDREAITADTKFLGGLN